MRKQVGDRRRQQERGVGCFKVTRNDHRLITKDDDCDLSNRGRRNDEHAPNLSTKTKTREEQWKRWTEIEVKEDEEEYFGRKSKMICVQDPSEQRNDDLNERERGTAKKKVEQKRRKDKKSKIVFCHCSGYFRVFFVVQSFSEHSERL
jgi:hypothetical protein